MEKPLYLRCQTITQRLLDKNIVRPIKGETQTCKHEPLKSLGDIPQLAGIKSSLILMVNLWKKKSVSAWDITTQAACASGLLALRDAGIPLTPVEISWKGWSSAYPRSGICHQFIEIGLV